MLELVLQAVPIKHGLQEDQVSYLASITFGEIAKLLDDGFLCIPTKLELSDSSQSEIDAHRVHEITNYILETYQNSRTFLPPICTSIHILPTYKDGYISFPYNSLNLCLTDGKYRCLAIHQALQIAAEQEPISFPTLSNFGLGMYIYPGLSSKLESRLSQHKDVSE